jgi:predicted Fe-S protein YdhL (DUF1289 family)
MSAVPSPCINVCRMDAASGWCEGCQRTLAEIAAWGGMDDDAKRAVWQALPARRAAWALRRRPLATRTDGGESR